MHWLAGPWTDGSPGGPADEAALAGPGAAPGHPAGGARQGQARGDSQAWGRVRDLMALKVPVVLPRTGRKLSSDTTPAVASTAPPPMIPKARTATGVSKERPPTSRTVVLTLAERSHLEEIEACEGRIELASTGIDTVALGQLQEGEAADGANLGGDVPCGAPEHRVDKASLLEQGALRVEPALVVVGEDALPLPRVGVCPPAGLLGGHLAPGTAAPAG